jgi:hypothetical protein
MSKIAKINKKFKEQPMLPKIKKQTNHKCFMLQQIVGKQSKNQIDIDCTHHVTRQEASKITNLTSLLQVL